MNPDQNQEDKTCYMRNMEGRKTAPTYQCQTDINYTRKAIGEREREWYHET